MHKPKMSNPTEAIHIYNPALRAMRRDRAQPNFAAYNFLHAHACEELLDRLSIVQRDFPEVLVIGCPDNNLKVALTTMGKSVFSFDPGFANARGSHGVQGEEDALPFADDSFDLILCCGTLESVNDLPGALVLMRRALRPDGLLLAAFTGAGTLPVLRQCLLEAEGDSPGAHIHPQIEVRAFGDLLQRAGFAMPVVDSDVLDVRYSSLISLLTDLRGMGASNSLSRHSPPFTKSVLARACEAFASKAEADGKTREHFSILYASAWKPDASQPKPARRGSARVSLADALKPTKG
jgi:NADH dehydrogenase [ubiquinone] 1 alpha subcomplex assembly factor 5